LPILDITIKFITIQPQNLKDSKKQKEKE